MTKEQYKNAALITVVIIIGLIIYDYFNNSPKGFGDTVSNYLTSLGIEKKAGCGCKAKHAWLNKYFPYP